MDPGGSSAYTSSDDGVGPSGMGGEDLDAIICNVAQQVMDEIARGSREQGGPSITQECMIEKFTKMNPLAFSGAADPIVAGNWMQEMEKVLTVFHCTNVAEGATHSFVSAGFVKVVGVEVQLLDVELSVAMRTRSIVRCIKLAGNHAKIDCHQKEVIFRSPGEQKYIFVGSRVHASPQLVSSIQSLEAALKTVPNDRNGKMSKEFLRVALDEIGPSPGLPPLDEIGP
ncbi:uncharacterized protein LOC131160831 [Malania oleifera]|uniref:uncharacterized protein LOC131160831 n=1 Tax=Malania oleifera TaxID=397392 RepID=UPI0025ADF0B8|nr:uncharacterized protein LOC131160831 [Malania oleifera]